MEKIDIKEYFSRSKADSDNFFTILESPLECMVGAINQLPAMVVLFQGELNHIFKNAASIQVHQRKIDGRNALIFLLTDATHESLFVSACKDFEATIATATDEPSALSRLNDRYNAWRRFWSTKRDSLTKQQVQGIIGELLYLEKLFDDGMSFATAVQAWHGSMGADQDFVFHNENKWTEVKTIRQSGQEITITSIEQLNNPATWNGIDNIDGRLAVVRIHDDPIKQDAFTLASLAERIKKRLGDFPSALTIFNATLEMTGANLEDGEFETNWHVLLMEILEYNTMSETFPKLSRNTPLLKPNIIKATYTLSLPTLEQWKLN